MHDGAVFVTGGMLPSGFSLRPAIVSWRTRPRTWPCSPKKSSGWATSQPDGRLVGATLCDPVCARAVSSAGRAPALHAGGRRFESCTAHQRKTRWKRGFLPSSKDPPATRPLRVASEWQVCGPRHALAIVAGVHSYRYGLHDTTGDDLGLIEHPAPNIEPGDHEGDDQAETARTDGIVSVCLGLSGLGPELRICGRRFDSSRGHPAFMQVCVARLSDRMADGATQGATSRTCDTRSVPTYRLHDTTGDDLGADRASRAERRAGNTRGARRVLAIRTSALGELAVVVWPVTEAPPKSSSSSSSHRSKCGLQMTRRWRFSRRSRIASDAVMPRSMRASATTVAERLSPTWQWTRMVCPRSRRRLTSCARSPNCFATSAVTSPSSTVTFTHSIPFAVVPRPRRDEVHDEVEPLRRARLGGTAEPQARLDLGEHRHVDVALVAALERVGDLERLADEVTLIDLHGECCIAGGSSGRVSPASRRRR